MSFAHPWLLLLLPVLPLLAWLKELKGFYEVTGNQARAEAVGRRLALIAP